MNDPLIKWASNRKSPIRSLGTMLATGEDYFGEEVSKPKAAFKAVTPISLSSFAEEGFTESGFKGAMFDFFGLNSFNESAGAFRRRKQDEVGREKFGKNYEDLPFSLRGKVEKEVSPMVQNLGESPTARQILNVQKGQMKRKKELVESLSEPVQEWLAANKLTIEGYSETTSSIPEFLNIPGVKGETVRLANDEEREMLAKLVSENVERMVAPLVGREGVRQETLDQRVQMAKRRAWAEMRKRIGK